MVQTSGVNAASRAQAEGKNFAQMANVSVVTVLKNGVNLGLSNVQKAQVVAEVVGQVEVRRSTIDGNSVLPQILKGAKAAADWVAGNYSKKVQAQQAMYAAGALAGDFSTAREETVQDRADYAVRMALDAADTVQGAGGLTTYEQLVIASQEAALVTARAGGTKKEVYTSVATAMHKVAALYGKPADVQAEWSAIGEAAAIDWYDQSFTKDVVDAKLEFKEILATSMDAAKTSGNNGGSLDDEILAAAEAAQKASEEKGFDTREQVRQASIAGAEVARQLPGDLQERADSAKHAAEKVALDTGFTQATADQEGDRAKRLVLEQGEVGGNAAEVGAELGPSASLAKSTEELGESLEGAALGLTKTGATGQALDDNAGGVAGSVAVTGVGTGQEGGIAEGTVGTALGSADSLDGEGDLGTREREAGTGEELGAAASESNSGSHWSNNLLVNIMVALAGLLMVAACGVCLRSMTKGSRHSHSKKATKRKVTLQAEEEGDEESRPLMASEALDKVPVDPPQIEISAQPGAAGMVAGAWNPAAYGGYVHFGGTLAPGVGGAPFATAPTLVTRPGSASLPPAVPVSTTPLPAVPISTSSGLPGAQEVKTMSLSAGAGAPVLTNAPLELVAEQRLGSGQIPVYASLHAVGNEVKQISYTEWHNSWQPGLPRDVVFTIPDGAVEGAALVVEVEPGVVVPTTVPAGAYPGALACLQR